MLPIEFAALPAGSPAHLVASSSATRPDYVLADGPPARFTVAHWQRSHAWLDAPVRLEQHLLSYCEHGGAVSTVVVHGRLHHAQQHRGSVTFLPAGTYERWQLEAPGEVSHLHLYIAPAAWPAPTPPAPLMDLRDPWFDGFFRLLTADHEACRAAGQLAAFDLLDRVGDLLLRRLAALTAAPPRRSAGRVAPLRPHLLRAVLEHVDGHLGEHLTLATLAALAGMSEDHFLRAFEAATGDTPHHWLTERRLRAARERLRRDSAPIQDIAHDCGFANAAHFCATFKRRYGLTPSACRRAG